jgi:hypothetical protein
MSLTAFWHENPIRRVERNRASVFYARGDTLNEIGDEFGVYRTNEADGDIEEESDDCYRIRLITYFERELIVFQHNVAMGKIMSHVKGIHYATKLARVLGAWSDQHEDPLLTVAFVESLRFLITRWKRQHGFHV